MDLSSRNWRQKPGAEKVGGKDADHVGMRTGDFQILHQ